MQYVDIYQVKTNQELNDLKLNKDQSFELQDRFEKTISLINH